MIKLSHIRMLEIGDIDAEVARAQTIVVEAARAGQPIPPDAYQTLAFHCRTNGQDANAVIRAVQPRTTDPDEGYLTIHYLKGGM